MTKDPFVEFKCGKQSCENRHVSRWLTVVTQDNIKKVGIVKTKFYRTFYKKMSHLQLLIRGAIKEKNREKKVLY